MNSLMKPLSILAVSAIALALALAGCGSDDSGESGAGIASPNSGLKGDGATSTTPPAGQTLTADLDEWSIAVKEEAVKSGKVKVTANNIGTVPHELVVIRTNKPANDLGTKTEVSEKGSAGYVTNVAAGSSRSATLDLKPGKYVLICNLPAHYSRGMHTSLTVK